MKLITLFKSTLVVLTLAASTAHAALMISFNPSSTEVSVGESFTIDVFANTVDQQTDAFLTFDIGFVLDESVLNLNNAVVGSSFLQAPNAINYIAGFPPSPGPIVGSNILLATLTFTATAVGVTSLDLGAAQFASLNPFSFSYQSSAANVSVVANAVSTPATLGLVVLAGALLLVRRKV